MLSNAVAVFLAYLAVVASRETMRPMPTITNSLVNLGKMEISFYFNGNGRDTPSHQPDGMLRSIGSFVKPEPMADESCPCSTIRNMKDSLINNPSGILNKILMSNDLFSFNKDPVSSSLCCESHEHVQEGTVIFEFPTNGRNKPAPARSNTVPIPSNTLPLPNNPMAMPMMPFLFDTMIPNKSMLSPLKTKSIEIFLFPKKKDAGFDTQKFASKKKDLISKDNPKIQVVGEKDIKESVSLFKPVLPVVKKDLNLQEKNDKLKTSIQEAEKEKEKEKEKDDKEETFQMIIEPASKPNAL